MADNTEERREKIQQLLTGYLKLKTEREHQRTLVNAAKIDFQWGEILKEAKSKELREEIMHLKECFIKAVDFKDAIIDEMQKKVEQTEVQNMWTACHHMQSLEKLIAFETHRSERLRQQYEKDLAELRDQYCEAKKEIEMNFEGEELWFKELQFIEKNIFEDFSNQSKSQFVSMQADIDDKVTKEDANVLANFDTHLVTIWRQFQLALIKYLEDSEAIERMFNEIKEEYDASMKDFQQDKAATEELQRSIPQLKATIEKRKNEHHDRIDKILHGHEGYYTEAAIVKDRIAEVQRHDRTSLTNLIINSGNALRELQELTEKGQKILKLHDRCQKMEAEIDCINVKESVAPSLEDGGEITKFAIPPDLQLDEACEYIGLLEKFWAKHSRVCLRNLALKKELDDVQLLNRQLKSDMSRFLKSVADKKIGSPSSPRRVIEKPLIQEAVLLAKNLRE